MLRQIGIAPIILVQAEMYVAATSRDLLATSRDLASSRDVATSSSRDVATNQDVATSQQASGNNFATRPP